jgi:tetratricopeptide (TPR) repeat protein/TolB-like protein
MAGLLKGYEYDIFISYRQNDNKYDGWVTAFVHNLTYELEATIKDKVSVYFDNNPQDGLLETHSVDKSLEEKLKCLIFIPVISKTYSDRNGFAWQHEFCAFNRLASEDKFGRDIRLSRGNFASRILPVRIHELDNEDNELIEKELGGSLRSIDFIYKSAGVNRPLRANEDHPHDNMNNTYYRDQINKVANAISEILFVLKNESIDQVEEEPPAISEPEKNEHRLNLKRRQVLTTRSIFIFVLGLIVVVAIILKLFYPTLFKSISKEKSLLENRISIAVMPFQNLTNDTFFDYLRLACQEYVSIRLSFYPEDFKVSHSDLIHNLFKSKNISYFSSLSSNAGSRISRNLDADILLLGSIYKNGEIIRLNAQLIDSKTEETIKPFMVEGPINYIMSKIDSLAIMVRNYLIVSKINEKAFQTDPENPFKLHYLTNSPDACRYHFLAQEAFYSLDYNAAAKLDSQAVAIDSSFIAAIVTLCWENLSLGKYNEAMTWFQKAYEKKDQMPPDKRIGMDYQYACLFQTPYEQIKCLRQLQKIEDNNPSYFLSLGYQYVNLGRYNESIPEFERAREIYNRWGTEPNDIFYFHYLVRAYNRTGQHKTVKELLKVAEKNLTKDNQGSLTGDQYLKMAVIYSDAGSYDRAEEYFRKAVSLEPHNPDFFHFYATSLIENNLNVSEGLELIDASLKMSPDNGTYLDTKGWGLYRQHKYDESLKLLEKAYRLIPSYEIQAHIDSVKAAIATQN